MSHGREVTAGCRENSASASHALEVRLARDGIWGPKTAMEGIWSKDGRTKIFRKCIVL
jgi:hypothetical protein